MDIKEHIKLRNLIKESTKMYSPQWLIDYLKEIRLFLRKIEQMSRTAYGKNLKNFISLWKNKKRMYRCLEIGSGNKRIPNFETLDIIGGKNIDYVLDAGKTLPFKDNTFDLIYASHVLEHIPWYKTERVLNEWFRILKSGGILEIWVPDGLKIYKILKKAEKDSLKTIPDNWDLLNQKRDPFLWVNGRLFYGARPDYPSWHKAIFTPSYLKNLFDRIGLIEVKKMNNTEIRGYDHGWINLGVKGKKP